MRPPRAAIAVLAALAFAGCLTHSAGTRITETGGPATSVPAVGPSSLDGVVLDDEQRPLADARVVLRDHGLDQLTDAFGKFAFPSLEPGSYELIASKLGWKQSARKVEVAYGAKVREVVVLEPVKTSGPVIVTVQKTGLIDVGSNPVQLATANQASVDGLLCSSCRFVLSMEPGPMDGLVEAQWIPSTQQYVNQNVWIYLRHHWQGTTNGGSILVGGYFSNRQGTHWAGGELAKLKERQDLLLELRGDFPGINLQHRLNVYVSASYGGVISPSFTALAPE